MRKSFQDFRDPISVLVTGPVAWLEPAVTSRSLAGSPVMPHGASAGGAGKLDHGVDWMRILDVLVATAALVFIAPLLLVLTIAVMLNDGGAPIYRQQRIGRGGRVFHCLKFRSMVPDAAERLERLLENDPAARREWETDHKLRNDPRVTPFGRFIRRTSLDELPQLINVIAGDMSLVGPRPIVLAETSRYGPYLKHYLTVRPGITGVWQVSGRNDVSYRRRIACDVLYARRRSLTRNLMIMAATVPAVLQSRGSY